MWELHLDWMAMNGINFPLAFTGQEYIWAKTFYYFNFSQNDLESFFSGPGFFAWQRMGNIQGWGGVLTQDAIVSQYELQIHILARMKEFGMTYALTAFAGHVPNSIKTLYPNATVTKSPEWNAFPSEYCCVYLLDFNDVLFKEIGSKFIEIQTKYYNTTHIYQCDTFNELSPSSSDSNYLKSSSQAVIEAMKEYDPQAVWLMQGWLFRSSFWNKTKIEAYLSGMYALG